MLPQGEKIRRAIRWISDRLQEEPEAKVNAFVGRAITKFDLNPRESEELTRFYQRAQHNH